MVDRGLQTRVLAHPVEDKREEVLRRAPLQQVPCVSWHSSGVQRRLSLGHVARLTQNLFSDREGRHRKQGCRRSLVQYQETTQSQSQDRRHPALSKASTEAVVTWIGCVLSIDGGKIQVKIPEEKIAQLVRLSEKFLKHNVVAIRELGKAMNRASVIFVWRPFLSEVWAALAPARSTGAPCNCARTQQIRHSLRCSLLRKRH